MKQSTIINRIIKYVPMWVHTYSIASNRLTKQLEIITEKHNINCNLRNKYCMNYMVILDIIWKQKKNLGNVSWDISSQRLIINQYKTFFLDEPLEVQMQRQYKKLHDEIWNND